jgi:hypothetical protein
MLQVRMSGGVMLLQKSSGYQPSFYLLFAAIFLQFYNFAEKTA